MTDRETGVTETVTLPCGSTRETRCPPCAGKARAVRMQQCREGWHRTDEPEPPAGQAEDIENDDCDDQSDDLEEPERRTRSTRRRRDAPDLPKVPMEDRTVGRVYVARDGREYRPSMFLTLTLPSYGAIVPATGVPADPATYDYRRAALDALHLAGLYDRFVQNLRRVAGYRAQYFAAVEPQQRLAGHIHAAVRGAIPRVTLRQVVQATYYSVWWPPHEHAVYVNRVPVWDGSGYCDPDTGETLPTWADAMDRLDADPAKRPAHVARFGSQLDLQGVDAGTPDADRAVRYLTKYLTKSIASGAADPWDPDADPRLVDHGDRLHEEVRWLPCSERCANWLRYGVQPINPGPGLVPGRCAGKAHDRETLGLGGRRVLVSRQWSGKTLKAHRADRADVVREALLSAGIVAPETERLATSVTGPDGLPRFVWADTDTRRDDPTYVKVILGAVDQRRQWREQYEHAKTPRSGRDGGCGRCFGNRQRAVTGPPRRASGAPTPRPPPDDQPASGRRSGCPG